MDSTCRSASSDATPHAVTRPALPAVGARRVPTPFPPAPEALLVRSVPIRSGRKEHPPWHPRARVLRRAPHPVAAPVPQLVDPRGPSRMDGSWSTTPPSPTSLARPQRRVVAPAQLRIAAAAPASCAERSSRSASPCAARWRSTLAGGGRLHPGVAPCGSSAGSTRSTPGQASSGATCAPMPGSSPSSGRTSSALTRREVAEPVDVVVMDLSYLAVADALPQLDLGLLSPGAQLVALVKPTYELLAADPASVARAVALVQRAMVQRGGGSWARSPPPSPAREERSRSSSTPCVPLRTSVSPAEPPIPGQLRVRHRMITAMRGRVRDDAFTADVVLLLTR